MVMIASHPFGIELVTDTDVRWIEHAIDIVCRNVGKPWRVALEQLADLQRAQPASGQRRFTAVVGAIQRVLGGRERNRKIAKKTRGIVLGHPALTTEERSTRIDHAALVLGMSTRQVETLLWADLPRERPVELPSGRPDVLAVAAFANVMLIQRALRRAQSLVLSIAGDPGPLVRAASARGLLVTAHAGECCVLEIVGPLALCHNTSVYGRALSELVPLLAELRAWSLEIRVELPLAKYSLHASSPVLLPSVPARLVATPAPVMRLARAIRRLEPTLTTETNPLVMQRGMTVVWPDLVLDTGWHRTYVELVGFWTREYLERKLASYRELGLEVVLCVDTARAGGSEPPPSDVLTFTKVVQADVLLAWIRARKHDGFTSGNVPETLRRLLPKIDAEY